MTRFLPLNNRAPAKQQFPKEKSRIRERDDFNKKKAKGGCVKQVKYWANVFQGVAQGKHIATDVTYFGYDDPRCKIEWAEFLKTHCPNMVHNL